MNQLITSTYRQQEQNDSALLLQHYRYKETPICLACLSSGEGENRGRAGAYLTGRLLAWFRGLSWGHLVKDPEGRLHRFGNQLKETLERAVGEIKVRGFLSKQEEPDLAGILCVGEHFILFAQGSCQILLLNRCFDQGYMKRIEEPAADWEGGIFLRQGTLQRGIGLLIATKSFCSRVKDLELKECLHVETMRTQVQADRHLRELGHRAEELDGRNMGAVLLLTELGDSGTEYIKVPKGTALPVKGAKEFVCGEMDNEFEISKMAERMARGGLTWARRRSDRSKEGVGRGQGGQAWERRESDRSRKGDRYDQKGESGCGGEGAVWDEYKALAGHGYEAVKLLGEGAFSRVFLVRPNRVPVRYLACKICRRESLGLWEGEVLQRAEHPLFPRFFGMWQEDGKVFLLMEAVCGSSLEAILRRRGTFTERQTARIGLELAAGLKFLHELPEPILFRDVKPANILIRQDGRVKLLDLGCACRLGERPRNLAGTPGYGAPEQLTPECELTTACDVYGLGRTLQEAAGDGCGKAFARVLKACTALEPGERLQDMRDVLAALLPFSREAGWSRLSQRADFLHPQAVCVQNIWESSYKNT